MCELALQGSLHLNACLNHVDALSKDVEEGDEAGLPTVSPPKKPAKQNGKGKEQTELTKRGGRPPVSVAAIVGGMSAPKQRRILLQGVDVLVATPGRLWDIIQQVRSAATILCGLLKCDISDRTTGSQSKLRNSDSSYSMKQTG